MALGASAAAVARMVARDGALLAGLGAALGMAVAMAVAGSSSVGCHCSMARKIAAGVALAVGSGLRTSCSIIDTNVVLPHRLVGDMIARYGDTLKRSKT